MNFATSCCPPIFWIIHFAFRNRPKMPKLLPPILQSVWFLLALEKHKNVWNIYLSIEQRRKNESKNVRFWRNFNSLPSFAFSTHAFFYTLFVPHSRYVHVFVSNNTFSVKEIARYCWFLRFEAILIRAVATTLDPSLSSSNASNYVVFPWIFSLPQFLPAASESRIECCVPPCCPSWTASGGILPPICTRSGRSSIFHSFTFSFSLFKMTTFWMPFPWRGWRFEVVEGGGSNQIEAFGEDKNANA